MSQTSQTQFKVYALNGYHQYLQNDHEQGFEGLFWFFLVRDVLRDLIPFAQFKKREKKPWRSVTFSDVFHVF